MRRNYVLVTGAIFGLVAILQVIRALNQWPVHIGTTEIPVWASWIAAVVAGGLCVWAFSSRASAATG